MYMIAEVSQYVAVASFAEAWIEIKCPALPLVRQTVSPPSRRRGLKSHHISTVTVGAMSPPSRRRGLKLQND